jgi:hypothetical protein
MMKKKSFNVILDFCLIFFILGGIRGRAFAAEVDPRVKPGAPAAADCASAQVQAPAQVAAPAFSGSVEGEWEIIQENQLAGPLKWKIVFVQDGHNLKVTNVRPKGEDVVCEGKVEGDKIEWVMTRPTRQGGESKYIYTGRIKDANTLEGFCQLGNTERAAWKAKRIIK